MPWLQIALSTEYIIELETDGKMKMNVAKLAAAK